MPDKPCAAVMSNDDRWTYSLRKEILEALLAKGWRVVLIMKSGPRTEELMAMGCEFIDLPFERHGVNPFHELRIMYLYRKALKSLRPDAVLTYTIKPNVYGGLVCASLHIPCLPNVTGLGPAIVNRGALQRPALALYRAGLRKAACVFFQNEENRRFMTGRGIVTEAQCRMLPGSGVNTEEYAYMDYPHDLQFLFISRILREKGIEQYLAAAAAVQKDYPQAVFHVLGGYDDPAYAPLLEAYQKRGVIQYHGQVNGTCDFQRRSCCTVHPSFYPEGMSNVLLESCSCGRPVITTDHLGCRETVEDGVTGLLVREQDTEDLIEKLRYFISLPYETRKGMGLAAREKVVREFDRRIVVKAYMKELINLTNGDSDHETV